MSKYTTQVRYICENYAGLTESGDYTDIGDILHASHAAVIGNYPIFDETYRETLDTKILKHYYTREICEETVGLWKLRLNARMNEIMPYYNKLYESELLRFNPLYDVDLTTSHLRSKDENETSTGSNSDTRKDSRLASNDVERNGEENSSSTTNSSSLTNAEEQGSNISGGTSSNTASTDATSSSTSADTKNKVDKYSDTPQGGINGMDGITQGTYLTNARIIDDTGNTAQTTAQNGSSTGNSEFAENSQNKSQSSASSADQSSNTGKSTSNDKTTSVANEMFDSTHSGNRNESKDISSTEDYLEHVYGKRSGISYAKLIQEYRDIFLNIDLMIIENLSDLFFGLWE